MNAIGSQSNPIEIRDEWVWLDGFFRVDRVAGGYFARLTINTNPIEPSEDPYFHYRAYVRCILGITESPRWHQCQLKITPQSIATSTNGTLSISSNLVVCGIRIVTTHYGGELSECLNLYPNARSGGWIDKELTGTK